LFSTDTELLADLGVTADYIAHFATGDDAANLANALDIKIKQRELTVDQVLAENLPYMTMSFINAYPTGNYLRNKGVLSIVVYTTGDEAAICTRIRRILQGQYEDFQVIHEGQVASGTPGIFAYRTEFYPLVRS
jgi:hypothetical protein